MTSRSEKDAKVRELARKYAETGDFDGHLMIEHALTAEGYVQARRVLDDDLFRKQLNDACRWATQRKAGFNPT